MMVILKRKTLVSLKRNWVVSLPRKVVVSLGGFYKVIDAVGKKVFTNSVDPSSTIKVSSKEFTAGVYSIRLLIGGKAYHSKLIITH